MKLKKVCIIALCCVMATAAFSSCGTDNKGSDSSTPSQQQTPDTQNPGGQTPTPEVESDNTPPAVTPADGQEVSEAEWDTAFERLMNANDITINYSGYRYDENNTLVGEETEIYKLDDGCKLSETWMGDKGTVVSYYTLENGVTYTYSQNENGEWEKEEDVEEELGFTISETDLDDVIDEFHKSYYEGASFDAESGTYIYEHGYERYTVMIVNGMVYSLRAWCDYGYDGPYATGEDWVFHHYGTTSIVLPTVKTPEPTPNPTPDVEDTTTYELLADGTINFGSYPQSLVEDPKITNQLTQIYQFSDSSWTSYGYYNYGVNSTDYMWYTDVVYDGVKYRGVYFTEYRPAWTTSTSVNEEYDQVKNGYNVNTCYWFEYEPINWQILSQEDGTALLLCNIAIDSQEFYSNSQVREGKDGSTIYANNYAESNIRAWLNENFYETAFNSLQKELIAVSWVENSERTTNPFEDPYYFNNGFNEYVCADTYDKIFLFSEEEITNYNYGFMNDPREEDEAKWRKATDYAKAQGCYAYNWGDEQDGNVTWWLRSPYTEAEGAYYTAFFVGGGGKVYMDDYVFNTTRGVVPALRIML